MKESDENERGTDKVKKRILASWGYSVFDEVGGQNELVFRLASLFAEAIVTLLQTRDAKAAEDILLKSENVLCKKIGDTSRPGEIWATYKSIYKVIDNFTGEVPAVFLEDFRLPEITDGDIEMWNHFSGNPDVQAHMSEGHRIALRLIKGGW